ncbi:MAG: PpiC-type peptidyl-prolyl cis-trans isomerase [uncultured bacterium]|uniref:peptidylprolyl isomerase n=1 Tax=Candidatus Gottesmanbacteria bacterium RIFCSPLOWO2_01_FULL_43_11b TaxID=1798392 RepID=A0A1F6AH92_9BACT|nr:MAG: PpiC-type peptidyl-prolyl cis-trans isomerase [uncultured bacterium]OGG24055.1 MAG: hypothetical protein A3A79_02565 [Candidatus Gottesmanbacteria bacterium RIFCSPLOWO2_01_FULL_43_11b]
MPQNKKITARWIFIVLLVALIALFLTNKGLLVAAIVNGKPVFRWELNNTLMSRFGEQTLEGIISERIIADAARSEGVEVGKTEVDSKIDEVVKGLGEDVKLEELLQFQGMTKTDFENQIRLQLTVEKLLGRDIQITEADIDNFIATNSATLTATEPAKLREEARNTIMSQKISEKLQPWFLEIKEKAKVFKFL